MHVGLAPEGNLDYSSGPIFVDRFDAALRCGPRSALAAAIDDSGVVSRLIA